MTSSEMTTKSSPESSSIATPIERFRAGGVIPAHPLALTDDRRLDERRQRALTRYYVESGALGVAVAVHSTQFAVHEPARGLLEPVLSLAAETAGEYVADGRQPLLVAGISGDIAQAVREAELARSLGYHLCLLAPYGVGEVTEDDLIERARLVGEVLPVVGFYLQPAVGGRRLSRDFWRRLADLPSVVGVKAAPFNRYLTLDVVHGLAASERADQVALYTGNDDAIVADLLTTYEPTAGRTIDVVGGLLGQWAVWAAEAVQLHQLAQRAKAGESGLLPELLRIAPRLTDANGVLFDAANNFAGCIPGIHEALRRQGLLANLVLLDEDEVLSPGQLDELDRVWRSYPDLRDDAFVAENLDRWLA